ncbi:hypothetical protein GCM10025768_07630 [Microbacterium pseudoresistens]
MNGCEWWSDMKKNELVWRELVDAAIVQRERRWNNVDDVAFRAGVAPATAAYALRRVIEIGAIQQHHAGFTVVNPAKVLTLLCAARSILSDTLAIVTMHDHDIEHLRDRWGAGLIAGGAAAAVELLGGVNTVSDYSERIFYLRDGEAIRTLTELVDQRKEAQHSGFGRDRGNVTLLLADPRAARNWRRHTSFAQTYADLFATPGWQASEFRLALDEKYLSGRDWDQDSA